MIRQVRETDIKDITSIYNHYVENTVVSYEEQKLSERDIRQRVSEVLADGFPWLVAVDENEKKIVGFCYANFWKKRSAYRHTSEVTVYLDHECIGKGWGKKLYHELFAALKARGMNSVIGGISLPNPASVGLHEAMGMEKVAHFNKIGFKFEQWLDVGYWQGSLEELVDK